MGFPFEIITMLGSTILGGVMSIWADSRKAKEEQQRMLITRGEFEMKAVKAARDNKDKGFQLMMESDFREGGALHSFGKNINFEGVRMDIQNNYKIYGFSVNYLINNFS